MLAQATRNAARRPVSTAFLGAAASASSSAEASSSSSPRAITTASPSSSSISPASVSDSRLSRSDANRDDQSSWRQSPAPSSLRQFHKSRASSVANSPRFTDSTLAHTSSQPSHSSSSSSSRSITPQSTIEALQRELQGTILPGLPLPDSVALQMVTHESWDYGKSLSGHNRRLAFLGRRALQAFLVLFLDSLRSSSSTSSNSNSSSTIDSSQDRSKQIQGLFAPAETTLVEEWLHTSALGQGAGASLRLERVMRWTPASAYASRLSTEADAATGSEKERSDSTDGEGGGRESGLYKIRGVCVEALVGALYHQHGAHVARLFFDSQILPTLHRSSAAARSGKGVKGTKGLAATRKHDTPGSWVRDAIERRAEEATGLLNMVIVGQKQQQGPAVASTISEQQPFSDAQSATTSKPAVSASAQAPAPAPAPAPARAFAFKPTDAEEGSASRNVAYAVGG